jgi:hypothetical protein
VIVAADLKTVLRPLVEQLPPYIKNGGSIQNVREFRKAHAKALKVYKKSRASEAELRNSINVMEGWFSRQ